jgi:ABC-type transport system involved in cytochrome c biogenesis permease subunit
VLTITLGYAAFSLSLVIGNLGLGQLVFTGRESKQMPLRQLAFYAYRAVQVGVVLLAAGTILGGVWADYSWGRFWGWDPKETWALIALLGYVALVHARFRGMVGPFGFLAGCVSAFLGVLMAWYGVNFVLGVGLHSYGFSSGGVSYVATYCSAQLAFVVWAWLAYRKERSSRDSARAMPNEEVAT